jgi:hypothetical protein
VAEVKFDFATSPGAAPALPLDGAPLMTVFGKNTRLRLFTSQLQNSSTN